MKIIIWGEKEDENYSRNIRSLNEYVVLTFIEAPSKSL